MKPAKKGPDPRSIEAVVERLVRGEPLESVLDGPEEPIEWSFEGADALQCCFCHISFDQHDRLGKFGGKHEFLSSEEMTYIELGLVDEE